jgi:hypothetical protein
MLAAESWDDNDISVQIRPSPKRPSRLFFSLKIEEVVWNPPLLIRQGKVYGAFKLKLSFGCRLIFAGGDFHPMAAQPKSNHPLNCEPPSHEFHNAFHLLISFALATGLFSRLSDSGKYGGVNMRQV